MEHSAWSILPPLIAIILALWTKEVYMSLIIAIFSGALLYTGFNPLESILTMFAVMEEKVGSNVNILVFLVILGILVAAISKSGATRAYGEWAAKSISGKRSTLFLTALLGIVIFIDDYFNCLTVGTVMRPITDKFKISRAKLAYVIDTTAAPICIIAPVSSWAAAVSSSLPENSSIDGFELFIQTIPFNLYAILAMIFMVFIIFTGRDFSAMGDTVVKNRENFIIPKEYRDEAEAEYQHSNKVDVDYKLTDETENNLRKCSVMDLFLPILVLIIACVYGMLYTGGIHEGSSVTNAFANCDASKALVLGSFIAFIFTGLLYMIRRILSFKAFCECFSNGFKAMVPAIFILCLAWTLSGICNDKYLDLGGFVGTLVSEHTSIVMFLPPVFFVVSLGMAFATGTSWGTFGILIPIAVATMGTDTANTSLLVLCVAAILSGAVSGDHASPISDTTILASAGAQCHHIEHVRTQFPYVMVVSACSLIGYLVDGVTLNGWMGLAAGFICLLAVMFFIKSKVQVKEI